MLLCENLIYIEYSGTNNNLIDYSDTNMTLQKKIQNMRLDRTIIYLSTFILGTMLEIGI